MEKEHLLVLTRQPSFRSVGKLFRGMWHVGNVAGDNFRATDSEPLGRRAVPNVSSAYALMHEGGSCIDGVRLFSPSVGELKARKFVAF